MASMATSGNTSMAADGVTMNDVSARNVAYFKGALVSVKHIEVKIVTLTRTDLLELNDVRRVINTMMFLFYKQMRLLKHVYTF